MLLRNRAVRNSNWSMICTSSIVIIRSPSEIPLAKLLTVTVKQQENCARQYSPEVSIRTTAIEQTKTNESQCNYSNVTKCVLSFLLPLYLSYICSHPKDTGIHFTFLSPPRRLGFTLWLCVFVLVGVC